MACIKIYAKGLSEGEKASVHALALEVGCEPQNLAFIQAVGEPDPKCGDEIILVLATPAVCFSPQIEAEFLQAQNGGRRVICVWPENQAPDQIPPAAAKHCYSIVPWNVAKLRKVVADDDVTILEDASGEPLPKVETERNLCVEEKVKPK